MSLLDDVSIVVTPNGYKAGELYAVVPVPTEGAELVTNGDFATDSDWTLESNASISNNELTLNSSSGNVYALQSLYSSGLYDGKTLQFTYEIISNNLVGSGNLRGGGLSGSSLFPSLINLNSEVGTHTINIIIDSSGNNNALDFYITNGYTSGSIVIDNVSVKEYTAADMDVTRATAATRVDENGLVNYAEVIGDEEVTNGDFATDTDWSKGTGWSIANDKASYDGSGTGYQYILQSITTTSGKLYKINFDVLSSTGSNLNIVDFGSVRVNQTHLSAGNYTYYAEADASSENLTIYANGTDTFSIDNVSVKQVDRDNVPRIDYTGGGCPHILSEPQRTNVFIQNDISTWNGFSSYADETTAPDGTTIDFVNMEDRRIFPTTTISNSTEYTSSIYLKGNKTADVKLRNTAANDTVITLSTEWQRFELTATSVSTITNALLIDARYGQGMGAAGLEIAIYGGQVEAGSYATSYIPTSGSTVTRNQDIFTRDGIGSLINSTEGVLFLEMAALADDGTNRYISISSSTTPSDDYIYFRFMSTSNRVLCRTRVGGSTINTIEKTITDTTDYNKYAIKWKSGDYAFWINGVEVGTDTNSTIFGADVLNQIRFDFPVGSGTFPSKVKQLQVYNTALTDEQLLQLTGTSGTDFYESYAEMASALTYTIQ